MCVLVRFVDFWPKMTGEMQISLGLTCFQFAFALLLLSSHTRLGLCGRNCLRSQIKQTNQIYFFGQQLSKIIQNSSATVGDGKVMGTSIV